MCFLRRPLSPPSVGYEMIKTPYGPRWMKKIFQESKQKYTCRGTSSDKFFPLTLEPGNSCEEVPEVHNFLQGVTWCKPLAPNLSQNGRWTSMFFSSEAYLGALGSFPKSISIRGCFPQNWWIYYHENHLPGRNPIHLRCRTGIND